MPIPAGGGLAVEVDDVKARLNKTLDVDDTEIQRMIDAAIAEYEEHVGPTTGSVTEKHSGGRSAIVLHSPHVASITSAIYSDGTAIDVDDLDLDTTTGILHWNYGTAGWFAEGTRNITITYVVAAVPENHRETIIADVAGYFAATQRGGASFAPRFAGEGYAEPLDNPIGPVVLFPRIRDLAPMRIA